MSEEIKEEKLDSPLVVHKPSDASYQASASDAEMNETRTDDDGPTLSRHRFKKTESKKGNKSFVILLAIVVVVAVIGVLFAKGSFIPVKRDAKTTAPTTQPTTDYYDQFAGTIVVKGVYVFVEGYEVQGIEGLQIALKYEDPSTTAYEIIDENADSEFLNGDILPLLMDMGFYGDDTVIKHKVSTGLVAEAETTTTTITTTTVPSSVQ